MAIGKMNKRIELQRKTSARDSYGEPIETWSTYSRPWAKLVGGAGSEKILGQQLTGRAGVVLELHWRSPEPEITERVKLGTRTFDINDVDNVESRNRTLILTCTEVTS